MPREPESLEDSYRALQTMHDVAHRKEEELDRRDRYLPVPEPQVGGRGTGSMNARYVLDKLAIEAAKLPESWLRCEECGCSFEWSMARDLCACPLCGTVAPEDQ